MLNKIFSLALAVAVVIMGVLTFLAYRELQSVGFAPTVIVENYLAQEANFWQFLWLSSAVLLVAANVLLWTRRQSWALWATFIFFAFFVLLETWWLNGMFLNYQRENNLTQSTFSFWGLGGTALCVILAIGIFFDQFLVLRLRERIYGMPPLQEPAPSLSEEIPPNKEI